jgi:6-pyruvoyltetrahydropterin/6-carboxytetrahydropterin synthase
MDDGPRDLVLTASRRFAFSASRRLADPRRRPEENQRVWGAGAEREWGSGENYEAFLVLEGRPDSETGMLVNLTTVKDRVTPILESRYDHRFLNGDTPPFDRLPPTPEAVARQLFDEASDALSGLPARLAACHLRESAATGATAWADGRTEREFWLEFSAARRTYSPHPSEEENQALFGRAASPFGHGHGYRLRVVLAGTPDPETGVVVEHARVAVALGELHALLDHTNLSAEVSELAGMPVTTECLARFIHRRLGLDLPVDRVRLHEMPHFFAEHDGKRSALGLERSFSAAHCLRLAGRSEAENRAIYGKCANPNGHGHRYTVQATVAGDIDELSGTVSSMDGFDSSLASVLDAWDHRHLDREVVALAGRPSTGEEIALALWPELEARLGSGITRLRIFETANNRFTLRRRGGGR